MFQLEAYNMKKLTILAILPWYPNSAPRYLCDAFEQAGHRVINFGPDYNNWYDIPWRKQYQARVDIECQRDSVWHFDDIIDECTNKFKSPDLIFASEESYHNEIYTSSKIPIVLYSIDGWPENFDRYEVFQPTIAYMEDPLGIRSFPRKEQDPRWKFMPGAAAPWVHQDLRIPRILDFYFCGSLYVNRPILCEYLKEKGFRVEYGKADTGQYAYNLSSSLTTLHDCNMEDRVKWRFFEGSACGCVVISDHTQLLDWLGYKPNVHYLPCGNFMCEQGEPAPDMAQVADAIQWVKNNPPLAQEIANNGKLLTLENHTYNNRVGEILNDLTEKGAI